MSKATRQTVGLLAIISGSIKTISDFNLAPDAEEIALYTLDTVNALIKCYPITGTQRSLEKYVEAGLQAYDNVLGKFTTEKYSAQLCVAMAIHIILDLKSRIRNKEKLEILEPIHEVLEAFNEKLDPLGQYVDDFNRAGELVSLAYEIFEF